MIIIYEIIVVGCGKIGYTIAKVLSEKKDIDVTVVDNNPNIFDKMVEPIDVIFISGNGANEKTLIEAGAKDADLIVSTTNADELNVLCCIMAERLGTKHSIARVRNPDICWNLISFGKTLVLIWSLIQRDKRKRDFKDFEISRC